MIVICVTQRTDDELATCDLSGENTCENARTACGFKVLSEFATTGNAGDAPR